MHCKLIFRLHCSRNIEHYQNIEIIQKFWVLWLWFGKHKNSKIHSIFTLYIFTFIVVRSITGFRSYLHEIKTLVQCDFFRFPIILPRNIMFTMTRKKDLWKIRSLRSWHEGAKKGNARNGADPWNDNWFLNHWSISWVN